MTETDVLIPCPAKNCTVGLTEKGGFYSEDKSTWCDAWDLHVHTHCHGSFNLVEMDVIHMTCKCWCHTNPKQLREILDERAKRDRAESTGAGDSRD